MGTPVAAVPVTEASPGATTDAADGPPAGTTPDPVANANSAQLRLVAYEELNDTDFPGDGAGGSGGEPLVGNDTLRLDGDGLPDVYEREVVGTDPVDPDSDATSTDEDPDGDGLTNIEEQQADSDPRLALVTAKTEIHEIGHSFEAGEADDRSIVEDPGRKFQGDGEVYSGSTDDRTAELLGDSTGGTDVWSIMSSGCNGGLVGQPMEGRYFAYSIEELLPVN